MQEGVFANELSRRRSLSNGQRRAEFWKMAVPALVCWAIAAIIADHLIEHAIKVPVWGVFDLSATLAAVALALVFSVVSWLRYKDWRVLRSR